MMKFEIATDFQGDLGAPINDVAQEAIDATATVYSGEAGIDVERELRAELSSRNIRAVDEETLSEIAHQIRSGHHVSVGEPDGSVAEHRE